MSDRHAISPYPIRMPADLRARLEESAKHGARSLHSEIISRLEASFEPARESFFALDGAASPDSSYTSSAQLIGTLAEIQAQMAALQDQLRAAHERECLQEMEPSKKE